MGQTAARPREKFLAWFQGIYYAVAGIWLILHIDNFVMVTGLKTDIWLWCTRLDFCLAAYQLRITLEMIVLAPGLLSL